MNTAGKWVHISERMPVAEDPELAEDNESVAVPVFRGISPIGSVRMARVILRDGWLDKGVWYDEQGESVDVQWWLDMVPPPKETP